MADWTTPLPGPAHVGNPTHVSDHDALVAALEEVRANVDGIELTPGPKGDTGAKGATGAKGDKGDPGFPSETDWNALVARVTALENPE